MTMHAASVHTNRHAHYLEPKSSLRLIGCLDPEPQLSQDFDDIWAVYPIFHTQADPKP